MRLFFSLFLCFNCWFQLLAQTQKAEELRSNVVSISAQGQYGFGFITGEHNRKLFIATAAHVVEYALDGAQMVDLKFYNDYNSYKGKILRSYADVDVALIEVDKPTGFAWKANCLGVATASSDAAFVGRDREWYVPAGRALGTIYSLGNNQLQVDITSIPVGTSGSPLIVESGIVGMILSTDGIKATALDLNQLRAVLSEYNYFFELTGDGFTSSSSGPTDIDTEAIYKDIRAYKAAEEKDDISAYQVYLRDYPSGEFRDKAIERIQALEQEKALRQEDAKWEVAKVRNDVKGYQAYLDLFPNGRYQSEAKRRINQLKQQSLSANQKEITIKDRDGNTYYTKVMKDGKRWMTKNMNVEVDNSWCYDNQTTNCDKYGRLYTYEAAKEACSSLGAGWRLPKDGEWKTLITSYGGGYYDWSTGKDVGNPKLSYKILLEGGGSGFAALLGGSRSSSGEFFALGPYGGYWSSAEIDAKNAWHYLFSHDDPQRIGRFDNNKSSGFSCRCVKD